MAQRDTSMTAPRVFISHAGEDRQRFVMGFAQRLRENGVDAWLDQWEMKPGDHFVEKIFEQGLRNADAVIIVLSAASVNKPWVREELNVSVVKRVQEGLKLIPVVIDACEIPECLQATLWQRIDDLSSYDDAFQRILAAIFDRSGKPELGKPPERFAAPKLPDSTGTDEHVLNAIYLQEVIGNQSFVALSDLRSTPALAEAPEDEVLASLEILESKGLIQLEKPGGPALFASFTTEGFRHFAEAHVEGYQELLASVAAKLLNEDEYENQAIAAKLDCPIRLTNYLLDVLEAAGHLTLAKYGSGVWEVAHVSPTLKRAFLKQ
jgi:hypothetical protein